MTEFSWRPFPSNIGTVFRPIALAELISSSRRGTFAFLVDSGADITAIPFDPGVALGFQLQPNDRVYSLVGVGGSVRYVIRRVEMHLAGRRFNARIAWVLSRQMPYLLGKLDVFEHFQIVLNQRDLKTTFIPF
jgi:hypothetical protein